MAIPSVHSDRPDVAIDNSSWIPSFLPAILENPRNRFKACIVAAQADKLGIHLYDYRPCSFDSSVLLSSTHVIRQASGTQHISAIFRPCPGDGRRQRSPNETETETIADVFARMN
jgi:hypothetical protein